MCNWVIVFEIWQKHRKYYYLWHGSRWGIVRKAKMTELVLTTVTTTWKAADMTSFLSCCRKCQLCEGQWENGLPKIWKVDSRDAHHVRCNIVHSWVRKGVLLWWWLLLGRPFQTSTLLQKWLQLTCRLSQVCMRHESDLCLHLAWRDRWLEPLDLCPPGLHRSQERERPKD